MINNPETNYNRVFWDDQNNIGRLQINKPLDNRSADLLLDRLESIVKEKGTSNWLEEAPAYDTAFPSPPIRKMLTERYHNNPGIKKRAIVVTDPAMQTAVKSLIDQGIVINTQLFDNVDKAIIWLKRWQ